MKISEFVKKELSGWKKHELILLILVFTFIITNAIYVKDNPVAIISAICGITYTMIAGKGKVSCYIFGILSSCCYSWLSLVHHLWGNLVLNFGYYLPMQIAGIFQWKKHLIKDTQVIEKTKLSVKWRIIITIISILGCIKFSFILWLLHDKSPIIDGITTFLSIVGMFLTVKRCIEQWIIWAIVNGLSFVMWLILVLHGAKTYSTVIMWGIYFILAVYFYFVWKKEINNPNN